MPYKQGMTQIGRGRTVKSVYRVTFIEKVNYDLNPEQVGRVMEKENYNRKLIATLLSRKPSPDSYLASLVIILVCTVLSVYIWKSQNIYEYFVASGKSLFVDKRYWQLVTTTFAHADFSHLVSNSYMLGIIGYFVYAYFGFLVYPLIAIIFSAVINLTAIATYDESTRLLGASGMVYFLYGFWLAMYVFIERKFSIASRLIRVVGFGLVVLFPSTFEPQVSYRTHAIGFLYGIMFAVGYFLIKKEEIRKSEEWVIIEEDE